MNDWSKTIDRNTNITNKRNVTLLFSKEYTILEQEKPCFIFSVYWLSQKNNEIYLNTNIDHSACILTIFIIDLVLFLQFSSKDIRVFPQKCYISSILLRDFRQMSIVVMRSN